MAEERDRILKLLEEGKITADQAARLIEALGARLPEPPPAPPIPPLAMGRHWRRHSFGEFDRIPDLVAKAVSSAVRSAAEGADDEAESSEFAGKRDLSAKAVSGDIEVSGWAEERVVVRHSGGRARGRDDGVSVNAVSGDVSAQMPTQGRAELVTVSGDLSLEGTAGGALLKTVSGDVGLARVSGGITVTTVSGDIELDGVSGKLDVATKSGDVEVEAAGEVSGAVSTRSGDVTLVLPRNADLVLELVSNEGGDIDVELESAHETLEEKEGARRIRLGAGKLALAVRTEGGDITVREQEEQE